MPVPELKIVIAPNALKGSLSAHDTAMAMANGIQKVLPDAELVLLPVADGGDGLLEVLKEALDAKIITKAVTGPLGKPVNASFLFNDTTKMAILEMAEAAGLARLTMDQYNPMQASTRGVGEMIMTALELGAKRITLGIGGSATNDGGTGMATALGIRFLDASGQVLPGNGESLGRIKHIDMTRLDPRLAGIEVQVICDVDNPLLGEHGASRVFAPQKGATSEQVSILDSSLAQLASVIEKDLGRDIRDIPGSGAAGGLGGGLVAFLNAQLKPGAEVVLDLTDFEQKVSGADLILTAEGRLDEQTAYGKVPAVVAKRAQAMEIPCLAIAGSIGDEMHKLHQTGINAAFSLCPGPISLGEAMQRAPELLTRATEQTIRCYLAGLKTTLKTKGTLIE
ncbi:MAG: glycerate kinase [Gammaproteobacteria bacterium]|nr:MAG: glycerate kinase [Gammaproteobacteria bacterium]